MGRRFCDNMVLYLVASRAHEPSKLVLQTSIGLVVAISHDIDSVEYGT